MEQEFLFWHRPHVYQDTTGSIPFRSVPILRVRVPLCAFLGAWDFFLNIILLGQ